MYDEFSCIYFVRCSCPSGYSGSTCEVKQEEVEAFLLPAVISASVLGPLAILFCILCIVLACRRRTKSKKEEERMYTETLARSDFLKILEYILCA